MVRRLQRHMLAKHMVATLTRYTGKTCGARFASALAGCFWLWLCAAGVAVNPATAHPLGNFTINHFARLEPDASGIRVRYVLDMAEIPTFQESQRIDEDSDGKLSLAELDRYAERTAAQLASNLTLRDDGTSVMLHVVSKSAAVRDSGSGLPTLRLVCDFACDWPTAAAANRGAGAHHQLTYADNNSPERIGWREIVVRPAPGLAVFDSTAYGSPVTNELLAYPQDMLTAPLDERRAELSWTTNAPPAGVALLRDRDGKPTEVAAPDRLATLISAKELTPLAALFGLLVAAGLGTLHAFSPGHGKTVVGAYLVGSRGTAKHAMFLGLTVTITHTLGVFALGLVTLFASQYVVPERLYPILTFVSGAIVLIIGLSLFARRLRLVVVGRREEYDHGDDHQHLDDPATELDALVFAEQHARPPVGAKIGAAGVKTDAPGAFVHSHGGGAAHSHLPPGADGGRVTWRNLLALGISGGLLPCPSALVVLLAAISLHRVGYGLALVVAFSVGLAATLTAIGLLFVYASRFVKRPAGARGDALVRVLPVLSALVIACLGAVICYQGLMQAGLTVTKTPTASAQLTTTKP